ncbi:MAG: hypothetical protein HQ494_01890 [Rhodospirillales bacterium]|nr:hypothetical protein [Rhodospirillales bacterium]
MRAVFLALAFMVFAWPAFSAVELVMFNSTTCEWCEVWEEEVGVVYGKTAVGQNFPVHRVDIFDDRPANLKHLRGIRFTPTFVLLKDGVEAGRITGYPGESFFWGLLEKMVEELDTPVGACNNKKLVTANATPTLANKENVKC